MIKRKVNSVRFTFASAILAAVAGAIVQWFFWILPIGDRREYNVPMYDSSKAAIWENATFNEYSEPTQVDEERDRIKQDGIDKIHWFFAYWNARKYWEARDNIHSSISWIFTDENMKDFREKITEIIDVRKITIDGEVWNSEFSEFTKNLVELRYWYEGKRYEEEWFVVVIRLKWSEEKRKEYHIKEISCRKGDWPLCKNFSQY
jgi:hypothetical protein